MDINQLFIDGGLFYWHPGEIEWVTLHSLFSEKLFQNGIKQQTGIKLDRSQPQDDTFRLHKGLPITQDFVKASQEAGASHSFNSSFLLLPGLGLRNPMTSCKGHSSLRNRVDLGQMQSSDSSYSLTLSLKNKGERWRKDWQHHEVSPRTCFHSPQ